MQSSSSELISELLLGMRLCGVQFRRIEVSQPLGVGFSNAVGRAQFHFVGRGPVWLHRPDEACTGSRLATQCSSRVEVPMQC